MPGLRRCLRIHLQTAKGFAERIASEGREAPWTHVCSFPGALHQRVIVLRSICERIGTFGKLQHCAARVRELTDANCDVGLGSEHNDDAAAEAPTRTTTCASGGARSARGRRGCGWSTSSSRRCAFAAQSTPRWSHAAARHAVADLDSGRCWEAATCAGGYWGSLLARRPSTDFISESVYSLWADCFV